MKMKCAICDTESSQKCSGCSSVAYCGRDHQILHWKNGHKNNCKSWKIDTNTLLGRHLVAIRNIKKGELIYKDNPIVIGPKIVNCAVCLGCHKNLPQPKKDFYKCSKCGWPLCGIECESSIYHKEECKVMNAKKFKSSIKFSGDINKKESAYCITVPLRVLLLKNSNPKIYEKIMQLESHYEERMQSNLYFVIKNNLVPFVQNILGMSQFDDKEIMTICGILDTNTYEIRLNNIKIRGLYEFGSMMSHTCRPNTRHVFSEDYQMSLIATVDIPKGQIISVSYAQPLQSTLQRRLMIRQAKCFDCCCERCSDPTEFGSYCGSMVCQKCGNGKLLSENPLKNEAAWKCDNEDCQFQETSQKIMTKNNEIRTELMAIDKTSPTNFEAFLQKYEKQLHPLNTHVLEVKYGLSQLYGNISGYFIKDLSLELLDRKINLSKELLEVSNTIEPGLSPFRGNLILDLQKALAVKNRKEFDAGKLSKEEYQKKSKQVMKALDEAQEILSKDSCIHDDLNRRIAFVLKEITI